MPEASATRRDRDSESESAPAPAETDSGAGGESEPSKARALGRDLRADVAAGFAVSLIALPLSLGIAVASGAPPLAGVVTAVVGGMLGAFVGGSRLVVNGPAAGLIVIVLAAAHELGAGDPLAGYRAVLAVGVAAGAIQVLLGLLRAGRLADLFPLSVVHGMLAGIGLVIVVKQIHPVLGETPPSADILDILRSLPSALLGLNPPIALIGVSSVLLMAFWPRVGGRPAAAVPAPLAATIVGVLAALALDLANPRSYEFLGRTLELGPRFLLPLPERLADALQFPDFARLLEPLAWKHVAILVVVASLESLLTAAAVDKMDPLRQRSDMNRELLGKGVGNMAACALGGLPMIAEVVRSKANIMQGARTRRANFLHGAFLLVFVLAIPGVLRLIPAAALAGVLLVVGFRLAHPREFAHAWKLGREEFLVMVVTVALVVGEDLLVGVLAGTVVGLAALLARGGSPIDLFRPRAAAEAVEPIAPHLHRVVLGRHVAFTNFAAVRRALDEIPAGAKVLLDFSKCRAIDRTAMERLADFERDHVADGGTVERVGFEKLARRGRSPLSAHHRPRPGRRPRSKPARG